MRDKRGDVHSLSEKAPETLVPRFLQLLYTNDAENPSVKDRGSALLFCEEQPPASIQIQWYPQDRAYKLYQQVLCMWL